MKFKIDKQKVKKGILFLKNSPWLIGEKPFPFFVTMIFIAIIAGSLFLVGYVMMADRYHKIASPELPAINEKTLKSILGIWRERQGRFDDMEGRVYPDLFSPKNE